MKGRTSSTPLKYPVFLIENRRNNKLTGYSIVYGPTGFTVLGRVPNSKKFTEGHLFGADGRIFTYLGSSGWPRFGPKTCLVLDNLVVPGLIFKLFERVGYYGPTLATEEHVNLEEFKRRLISSIENYGSNDINQLKSLLSEKNNFIDVLDGVDWWRFYAGKRDEDGHPV
jgi:hypothetical protein